MAVNPAKNSLTQAEHEVFKIVRDRQNRNKTTTSGDVAADWGKDRTYVYRKLMSLIEKGLIERYSHLYYRVL